MIDTLDKLMVYAVRGSMFNIADISLVFIFSFVFLFFFVFLRVQGNFFKLMNLVVRDGW